jgi:branched-chain amino acid aminotransferase
MIVFLNGNFVPEEQAVVSIFDRCYLYGDGLFETMLIRGGVVFRWDMHLQRLKQGAAFLNIAMPFSEPELREAVARLILENRQPEALLRLTLSRGVGIRGYSPRGANCPTIVMSLHPAPDTTALTDWALSISSIRLPANEPVAQLKHCNKLPQILARAQAEHAGADEALLTNTEGHVVEGATSNLFWVQRGAICTPPLSGGILSGVTRMVVLELCRQLDLPCREENITPSGLSGSDGVFVSLSSYGIIQAISLDSHPLRVHPMTSMLHRAYADLLQRETAAAGRTSV